MGGDVYRAVGLKGRKKRDNCNSTINKIYILKKNIFEELEATRNLISPADLCDPFLQDDPI